MYPTCTSDFIVLPQGFSRYFVYKAVLLHKIIKSEKGDDQKSAII